MSASRTKNAARNVFFGMINKFVLLFLPFVTRTLILRLLGASFLGIGTLFSSILSFLSLTQLGLDSAIVYVMYKPIAENDTEKICALLNYYKRLYRIIGIVILFFGTVIVPFLPLLINGDAPEGINIYILYYIYLLESVIGYFFCGYKRCLIVAHQRSDVNSNVNTVINLIVQFSKIFAVYFSRSFYVYALVPVIGTLLSNFSTAIITIKMYPTYVPKGQVGIEIKNEIKKKLTGLFGTRLNAMVVHSADVMVISAFLGLSMTAKYGNYHYIMSSITGFVTMLSTSMTAGIGNKLVTDGIDESYKLFKNLSFMNSWVVGWASVCFICLYEPFIKLWVGKDMQLGIGFVILFVFCFYIHEIQRTMFSFKDAMGLWHKDKVRPYASMIINIVLNLVLLHIFGIYGVVASTVIAFLISLPWVNRIIYKNGFVNRSPAENIKSIISNLLITVAAVILTYVPCSLLGGSILAFVVRGVFCITIPNAFFFLCYRNMSEFKFFISRLKSMLSRRALSKKRLL